MGVSALQEERILARTTVEAAKLRAACKYTTVNIQLHAKSVATVCTTAVPLTNVNCPSLVVEEFLRNYIILINI